jgi:hypothetical protein
VKRPTARRGALTLVVAASTLAALQGIVSPAAGAATPKTAPAASTAVKANGGTAVSTIEQRTARALAASLADPAWRAQVRSAALASKEVDLSALTGRATTKAGRDLESAVSTADRQIATAKGLDQSIGSLLRLRLGTQAMAKELKPGTTPLVAATLTDDKAATVTAYDTKGRTHTLSAQTAPKQAVYVVDIDVSKATSAGMSVMQKTFTKAGLHSSALTASAAPAAAPARAANVKPLDDSGYWATKMDTVWLSDDEEPWVEGDAEIYSLVSGFGLDGTVRVDSVDMPYLNDDHTTYNPGQLIINWSNYKYDAVDLVMMESDTNTNYEALAQSIADALLYITDNGAYQPLVDAILNAIPSDWYTNDDDYVDSWYAITEQTSGTLYGAANNGWMTVEPYWVSAL